ncbi:ABC transporter G family member 15 [Jatropha curcas]|uniref:ABC transporter G family member 15 n=1 Tax=Jatropha curcas TaxID=180498 RepID=UPI001893D0DB|nr:ABC transporter G family member 15 [Jatropha curcas]
MSGNVLLNGKQRSIGCKSISYVTQEDFFLGSLTVRETVTYSAHLRLPTTMSKNEMNEVVENTIIKMGLQECAENKIGNWLLRGISGGEKRRLSISLEILTQPHVMFLDEPTSGLDSASAFFVIQVLRNIALEGRLVVCSIHQPSSYIFDLFDDLCLLSSGETIYFGEAKTAIKFFAEAGFPCPTRTNPSDHFLRCINSDFDKIVSIRLRSKNDHEPSQSSNSQINLSTQDIKEMLTEKYMKSEYSINTRKRIREITLVNEELASDLKMTRSSWWKRLWILTKRSFVNMTRDVAYFWIRILFCILVSLGAGIMFFDIGLSAPAILARVKCYAFFYGLLLCLCVGGLPSVAEEWKVVYYERFNGHYGEGEFVFANLVSSFPFLAIMALSSGTIIHYMMKFHMGFSILWHFCINLFCCLSIMECVTMIVALLLPNFLMGMGVSSAIIMLLIMASGLYRPIPNLPSFFWRYPTSYISFTSWAVQGQLKNDMIGLEFEPLVPGDPKVKGEKVLKADLGVNLKYTKWWDLAALLLLLLCHRVVFFLVLKYKERAVLKLQRLCIKTPSNSFRRDKHGSFRRQQPLHALSSQEGLASPLPN